MSSAAKLNSDNRVDPHGSDGVCYLSEQNGSFRTEFAPLWADVDADLAWATAAFGAPAEAVNLWMGDARAVSAMHKDHYENMCVSDSIASFSPNILSLHCNCG
jgi:jumonji domain-containing protein 7